MTPHPQVLCRPDDILGEGPLWDHRRGCLLWIDIVRGRVHSWSHQEGMRDLVQVDALIGSIALVGDADLLLATSRGLLRWTAATAKLELLGNPIANLPVRFNDGRVDAAGRFWVGTMALDDARCAEPLGALYRVDPDGTVVQMEAGLTIANGLDWSPDGRTFYLTDTMRRQIYAYDFDCARGTIAKRRTLVNVDERHGYPDGLLVDRTGALWSAAITGSAIRQYGADGRLIGTVALPVSCPTAIALGGADGTTAFITTSQHLLKPGHGEGAAGSLLSMPWSASGRPAAIFGKGLI